MDDDEIHQHTVHQRAALTELLASLTPEEWEQQSLCELWSVRQVAAHVTCSPDPSLTEVAVAMVRARGRFEQAMHLMAVRRAEQPTDDIVARHRRLETSRRRPPGTTPTEPLVDVLVHTQDIARPLGRPMPIDVDLASACAARVWERPFPYRARERLAGVRLMATDSDWSAGEGEEVRGSTEDLLLLMTGRRSVIPALSGEGLVRLA